MAAFAERRAITTQSTAGYITVSGDLLRRLHHSAVDLFVRHNPNSEPVLYHRAGATLDPAQLAKLSTSDSDRIYVRSQELGRFGAHLLESVDVLVEQEEIPAAERFAVLQIAMAAEIEHAARLVDCGSFVARLRKLVPSSALS